MSSYGGVDEQEQVMMRLEGRRRTRKRITIIAVSSFVLACVIIGAVVGTTAGHKKKPESHVRTIASSVKAVCDVTQYKDACLNALGSAPNATNLSPEQLFKLAVQITIDELSKVSSQFSGTGSGSTSCEKLLELAIENLNDTVTLAPGDLTLLKVVDDLRTWLSSAGTYQQTCIDTLKEAAMMPANKKDPDLNSYGETQLKNSTEMTSNALAIVTWLSEIANSVDSIKLRRRLLTTVDTGAVQLQLASGRNLLENEDLKKMADIVVAKDGTAKYETIARALEEVPEKSEKRTIIYVKEGVYVENVKVDKKKWNVVMVGDGQDKTIVSGELNFVDGTTTFQTATFAVFGKGFMARDMAFRNTAGPAKHQAVALLVSADFSVFYRCTMDAYQDTLYVHSQRQFYRDCTILGTVDFIFGNSAVVFQNCRILPRSPLPGQKNTITAQGRTDPNQNTGISIYHCEILPFGNLSGVQTFLGRPWKNYSTTVFMDSFLDGFVDPKGWLPWTGETAPDTIFYGEYKNSGPGALTENRVKWKGLRFINKKEAQKFAVKSFINGEKWLPATNVPFKSGV